MKRRTLTPNTLVRGANELTACPVQSLEERIVAHGSRAWTVKEFAELFNFSQSGVYKMIHGGWLA